MTKLNEDYYLRKRYFEKNEVPSQSVMKSKMGTALANVYFKSMTPKLKVIAGLDPAMKGGGKSWYIPPKNLLRGRAVLKPIQRKYLSKLSSDGIEFFGPKFVDDYQNSLELKKQKLLLENDLNWRKTIKETCKEEWKAVATEEEKSNSLKIKLAFEEFSILYKTSITKIESLLSDAGLKEIQRVKNETCNKMSTKFKVLQKQQSTLLHNRYEEKLEAEKNKYKEKFIEDIENLRTDLSNEIHDINIEKHVAVEKLRTLLEYQNLACQVYVVLKERSECNKEIEISKHKHEKLIKIITDQINIKDFEIKLAQEKEKKQQEFNRVWQKKICHVVKRFQEFVKYCLNAMPKYADFFIDMEKLMLLQLGDALENPSAESIFEPEDDCVATPTSKPNAFYLVCDKGLNPQIDQNLCPKHCTSSASQLPVIVVNKKCIYAACDNFEVFIDKVKQFLDGQRGDSDDVIDDHDYTNDVPINCTSSDQLLQLQLESSLMQILQNELPNVKQVPIECEVCKTQYCFCTPTHESKTNLDDEVEEKTPKYVPSGDKITDRTDELKHMREPNIDSYFDYIQPQICECAKKAKKHLKEHLPAYMRNISTFEKVDIPHYEICKLDKLRSLVNDTRKVQPKVLPLESETTKNASTQYTDEECDSLCNCFSDEALQKLVRGLNFGLKLNEEKAKPFSVFDGSQTMSHLEKRPSSFATEAALTLKQIIDESPELEEIFKQEM